MTTVELSRLTLAADPNRAYALGSVVDAAGDGWVVPDVVVCVGVVRVDAESCPLQAQSAAAVIAQKAGSSSRGMETTVTTAGRLDCDRSEARS